MDRKIYLEFEEVYKKLWYIQQELQSVSNMQVAHIGRVDTLQAKVDEHTSKIDSHSGSIDGIQSSVSSISSSVQGLSDSISTLDTSIGDINTSVSDINTSITSLTQGQATLKNNINSISMCPSNIYTRVVISSYKGSHVKIFTAPKNGYAQIRGDYTGTATYYVTDGTNYSFYQWAANEGCPFFALKAGDSVYLESYNGTWTWADLYYVQAKEV